MRTENNSCIYSHSIIIIIMNFRIFITTDLGGIQAAINAIVHLNPEISGRIQHALRELNNELDVLDSEMRMKETDSQIAVSTSISTSESSVHS